MTPTCAIRVIHVRKMSDQTAKVPRIAMFSLWITAFMTMFITRAARTLPYHGKLQSLKSTPNTSLNFIDYRRFSIKYFI